MLLYYRGATLFYQLHVASDVYRAHALGDRQLMVGCGQCWPVDVVWLPGGSQKMQLNTAHVSGMISDDFLEEALHHGCL